MLGLRQGAVELEQGEAEVRGLNEADRLILSRACGPLRSGLDPSQGEVSDEADGPFDALQTRGLAYWADYDDEWLVFQATDLGHLALRVDAFVRANT